MLLSNLKSSFGKRRIAFIYLFYWLMLAYIIAALIFWFISLRAQSTEIIQLKYTLLSQDDPNYPKHIAELAKEQRGKAIQYIGEGITFLGLIIAGAIFVFRMLRKQLNLSRQQQDFVMAVTHELKTPIAITKLNLETILKRDLDQEQQKKLIRNSLIETDRLNGLCNNMLLLNDSGHDEKDAKEIFPLDPLLKECISEQNTKALNRAIKLNSEVDIKINTDKTLLKLAVNNLLNNALKYSSKETLIEVHSYVENQMIFIEVADQGRGIKKEEEKDIFRKYYRGNDTKAKGTGLGLYVTRRIIRQHGGKLEYRPNIPNGSIFTISFAVR